MTSQFIKVENHRNIRDIEVEEIYLSNSNLENIPDFSRYRQLKRLYLNSNKLVYLSPGLKCNYTLTELYLQNNQLTDISGYLQHLSCLNILLLHNNQLTCLTHVIHEVRNMLDLKVLNLMNNPLVQEYNYRDYVIHHVKSLELFDRRVIEKSEREKVFQKFEMEQQAIKDSIAFGRRVNKTSASMKKPTGYCEEDNKVVHHEEVHRIIHERIVSPVEETDDDLIEDRVDDVIKKRNMTSDEKYADAIESRVNKRSVMQVKVFDWADILQSREKYSEQKRNGNEAVIYSAKLK